MPRAGEERPIKADKFARVSAIALRDRRLSTRDKMVYVALCDYRDPTGRCWPSVSSIARLASLGITATHDALNMLCSLGYIERVKRASTSNYYHVYDIPMEDFLRIDDLQDGKTVDRVASANGGVNSAGEVTEGPEGEYFAFDKTTGVLCSTATRSPAGEDKEEKRTEILKELWKAAYPQAPTGAEKPDKQKAFAYFVRSEHVTEDTVKDVIKMVEKSTFLQGKNERNWIASLFWCLRHRELIMQGRYSTYTRGGHVFEI